MTEAWVTLATNDTYAISALVLAESLRRVKTSKKLHIMMTPEVSKPVRDIISKFYDEISEVDVLDSRDSSNLSLIKRPELGVTFTKLHCWTLTQYKKAVFIDADAMVLQNPDELFAYPEISAVPDGGWPDCFNSGVFVFVPNQNTYNALLEFGVTNGSFDGGDQGLLNMYFRDWRNQGTSHRLSCVYNMSANICYSYGAAYKFFQNDVKIIHFLGGIKPWHGKFDRKTCKVTPHPESQAYPEHVQFWWNLLSEAILPLLKTEPKFPQPNGHK